MDPVVDRLLVISGLAVCWSHALLPRWTIAVLLGREVFMLIAGRAALRRGVELSINWPGRLAVWPVMSAVFFAIVGLERTAEILLYVGLALTLLATAMYADSARRQLRAQAPSS
jgi:phosphatidylglycerophosphate synthase